jgi:hypothetical protein
VIDDVHLKSEAKSDVRLNSNWYAGASDYLFPEGQGTQGIPFMVDLTTLGNSSPGQTTVNVEVLDDAGASLFASSLDYGVLTADSTYENNVFPGLFFPTGNGTYTVRYTADAETDENPNNDVLENSFSIGGQIFSKVALDSDGIQGWRYNSQTNFASVGNVYKFVNGTWPNGNPITVDSVSFGYSVAGDASHLGFATVRVYQWEDVNGDGLVQGEPENERFLLGEGTVEGDLIDDATAGSIITVKVEKDGVGSGEALVLPDTDNLNLLVMVDYAPIDDGGASWFFYAVNANDYGQFNVAANVFALEAGHQIIQPGSVFGSGTDGGLDDVNARLFDQSGALVFHTPVYLGGLMSATDDFNPNVRMNVYPNPAAEYVNIDINLENTAEYANILVADINGKIVIARKFNNVSTKEVNLDLTNLASGVYTLQVITPEGFNSTKLSVVK